MLVNTKACLYVTYPQHVILLLTLCLETDFCSGDHKPKHCVRNECDCLVFVLCSDMNTLFS